MGRSYFSPGSVIWRVDREMALLLGGGRALLMQLAHPKVASGVADHSNFQEDPLRRLQRTRNSMWSVVFDEVSGARATLDRIKEAHRMVRGTVRSESGLSHEASYDALDPDLLLWVHATLVDSALVTYELFVRPLSLGDKVQYYEQTKKLALLFEVPENKIPVSLDSFREYMTTMLRGNELQVIPTARLLAEEILYPRPWVLRAGGPLFAFITAGLLPPTLREAYGLHWNDRKETWLGRVALFSRSFLPFLPRVLRFAPHARRAQKRLARRGS